MAVYLCAEWFAISRTAGLGFSAQNGVRSVAPHQVPGETIVLGPTGSVHLLKPCTTTGHRVELLHSSPAAELHAARSRLHLAMCSSHRLGRSARTTASSRTAVSWLKQLKQQSVRAFGGARRHSPGGQVAVDLLEAVAAFGPPPDLLGSAVLARHQALPLPAATGPPAPQPATQLGKRKRLG